MFFSEETKLLKVVGPSKMVSPGRIVSISLPRVCHCAVSRWAEDVFVLSLAWICLWRRHNQGYVVVFQGSGCFLIISDQLLFFVDSLLV